MTTPTVSAELPEALRLADDLEASSHFPGNMRSCNNAAAAELRRLHAQVEALSAAQAGVQAESWRPMETAPKDGTLVRLLVEFENHATEDGEGPQPTIGSNTADNTGEDIGWQFAGWCWTQDRYTQGEGKPVGWLPMLAAAPQPSPSPAPAQPGQEGEPVAWLVPQLHTFKGATRVHFTRAPGCTMTDAELIDDLEGRVMWLPKSFSDRTDAVVDKFGVKHFPKPLYTAPPPQAVRETTPEAMWDAFVGAWRVELGVDKIVNIMGGAEKLKAVFLQAAHGITANGVADMKGGQDGPTSPSVL